MIRTRLARRTATAVLALTASLGGLAVTAPSASAATSWMDCMTNAVMVQSSSPMQMDAVFTSVDGGAWQVTYVFSSGQSRWFWDSRVWLPIEGPGLGVTRPSHQGGLQVWTYSWTYDGSYTPRGWSYVGSC